MESRPQGAEKLSIDPTRAESDLQLAAAILRKDRKATGEFAALYVDRVYAYVRHRLIPRFDAVEDIVQEVFLSALDNLANFRGESSLHSWLLGIARHKVEDHYRRRIQQPEPLDSLDVESIDRPPEEAIDDHRIEEKIRSILTILPETYSLVLLWRYWEKRSAREIAAAIGRSEKAVERLLSRARAQFKKKWNNE